MIEQVTILANASYPLEGILTLPDTHAEKVPAVVFVHGSGALDKDETIGANKLFRDIADGLAKKGIASLRYDKRTYTYGKQIIQELGGSLTVEEEIIYDALFASRILKSDPRVDANRVFMIGHSQGGMLAPRIDAEGGDFAGLVILAGTLRTLEEVIIEQNEDSLKQLDESQREMASQQIQALKDKFDSIAGMSEEIAKQSLVVGSVYAWYLKEMQKHPLKEYLIKTSKPLFVLQGDKDVQVSVEKDFNQYQQILKDHPNASCKLYPGLNHMFMKAIYGTIKDIWEEYNVPQTVDGAVLEDVAKWIQSV
ncbi:S9 family peptidase [Paenibacillus sp. N3.4]|uniref:alpha/beta hydrolase family protein n=1 Tax=Paenibacillus sp. N3.4 TaxID=2603222 RepID=UPI0011C971B3|nr:alpha/beta hydrolase [Paenibacillus sp. N3.4]TXK84977.1 alpha/beta fold hydrolase [Paenibacillus sp. N3.4]